MCIVIPYGWAWYERVCIVIPYRWAWYERVCIVSGGLHHQSTQTLADSDRWTPSSSSGSSSCLSRPALRGDGGGLVGLG